MKTKKELKEEYKLKKFRIGVFQIRNVVNGKIYVDGSVNLDAIWNRHQAQLNFGGHVNTTLQKEWNEVGQDNFRFEVLHEIEQKEGENINYEDELKTLKEMVIEDLRPFEEKGYNKRPKM